MNTPRQLAAEHAAGRTALFENGAGSADLRKRFKSIVSVTLSDGKTVVVTVKASDKKNYQVECPFDSFPSDELIAQLMLLDQ